MAFFRTLGLLLWKNFVLKKRKLCVSLFEILLPVFFAAVLLAVRALIKPEHFDSPTIYPDFSPADLNDTFYNDTSIPEQYLLYLPNNTLVDRIMNTAEGLMTNLSVSVKVKGFSSEEDMIEFYRSNFFNVSSAIQFKGLNDTKLLPNKVEYSIRPKIHNKTEQWQTRRTYAFFQTNAPREASFPAYIWSGFILYQRFVDEAIIREWNTSLGSFFDSLDIRLQRMPIPPYIKDTMITVLQLELPVIFMLSFILSTIQNTKAIVYEKERKLKESMKLMGLSSAAHWSAWFLTIFIYTVIIMAIYSILFGISLGDKGAVLANSDPFLFFILLLCYGLSVIAFCFMISTFIQKANVAAAVAGILFFLTYAPYFFIDQRYEDMTRSEKLGVCLVMNLAMGLGGKCIGLYEGTGAGIQWSNFNEPASVDDNFSLLDAIIMLLLDSAIYFLITWYVDNVRPGEFGTPQPLYFPFTSAYWCGSKQVKAGSCKGNTRESKYFENDPTGMTTGIQIKKLKKVYPGSQIPAVNDMTLDMYEGQITVLLGHNGAGKTTTMSVLTGFTPPTDGTAVVNGYDIRTDMLSVRKSLGLCPQHNILFDAMTVEEHLWFFAVLKGCPSSKIKENVNRMIEEVGLELKRNAKSMTLSGGQKRKLSVGIALIGESEIVILDEPTSGMDPSARRQTWDILQKNKQGRTILLTTHFMDEADLLGDRIAIMAEGVVKCCGTSYFLKKAYGAGYHLVIVKEQNCKVPLVTEVITKIIPSASLQEEINAEVSYLLPEDKSHLFATLFNEIDNRKRDLGIISFGTSATTMEEVFLKVGESAVDNISIDDSTDQPIERTVNTFINPALENDHITEVQTNGKSLKESSRSYGSIEMSVEPRNDELDFNTGYTKVTGLLLEQYRFRGMFVKKAIHTWRNRTMMIVQLLLPVIFTILALVVAKTSPGEVGETRLLLDLSAFGGTIVPNTNGTNPTNLTQNLAHAYEELFDGKINKPEAIHSSNLSEYFLDKTSELGVSTFNKRVIIAGEYQSETSSPTVARAHYNHQPYHGTPIALAYMMNSIVSQFVGSDHEVMTANHPLPENVSDSSKRAVTVASSTGFSVSFNILFGMAFLTSSFVYFLIKERLVGAKHLQVVSGIGPFLFWVSNFAWDYINYFLSCLLLLVVFGGFQTSAYIDDGRLGIVVLILLCYGWAVLPFMYILQYMFRSPATGMVVIIILNIITGLFTTLLTFILSIPTLGTEDAGNVFEWIFVVVFPHFCLGRCFFQVYVNTENINLCHKNHWDVCIAGHPLPCCKSNCAEAKSGFCVEYQNNYLSWDVPGIGRYLLFMIFQGFFFMLLTLIIEYKIPERIWYWMRPTTEETTDKPGSDILMHTRPQTFMEDSDVLAEKHRIKTNSPAHLAHTDSLILDSVYKRYGNFIVVDHLTVGIPERECFGLLGQNGAGKTTTFKMLTGDVMLTGGNAYLKRYDVKTQVQKVQENMGYCPQFDALIDQMTGRETLRMFARFKGVPECHIDRVVNRLMEIMMLTQYADRQTVKYSGGNKRKLSTAIALVGNPSFIMLDEPSTGMDPKARRQLWNVLSQVRASGKTLVLTSHSMEECDALCTRIAIMVNGRFVCLGSPQHLKSKFGQGYTLIAKMMQFPNGMQASTQPLTDFIHSKFPQSLVFDSHQGYAHFQIPDRDVHLATVFALMEEGKATYGVENYSVHQTTLEQVFLTFTRAQNPPREDKTTFCKRVCCC